NLDYSLCFCNTFNFMQNGDANANVFPCLSENTFDVTELLTKNFMNTPSVVYRNGIITKLPDWFDTDAMPVDWIIHILTALGGKIGFLTDIM
ncbi:hypothetical protein, partial [Pseudomonas aeruginosa]|uniref:hypothetical protein n=1 Tax=Pseudomonas aeruginosa TaxID=287 RepID=UPI0039C17B79